MKSQYSLSDTVRIALELSGQSGSFCPFQGHGLIGHFLNEFEKFRSSNKINIYHCVFRWNDAFDKFLKFSSLFL